MKKLLTVLISVLMIATIFAGCNAGDNSSASAETLRIGVSGEYYPFCYSENDELQGFEIDSWNEIARRLDMEVEFSISDFSGLLGMLDSGKIDSVGYGVAKNAEREEKYLFSDPYIYSDFNVVTKKGSELNSLEDFEGKKIAVVMGAEGERKLQEKCEAEDRNIEIVGYEGPAAMDEDVLIGRVDARLAPKIQTLANIKKNDLDMEVKDIVIYSETDAYPFAKADGNEELVAKVNTALSEMRDDGTLKSLSEKWFNTDATAAG